MQLKSRMKECVALKKTHRGDLRKIPPFSARCIIRPQPWFYNSDLWPLTSLLYAQQNIQHSCTSPCYGLWRSFSRACDPDISPQLSLQLSSIARLFNVTLCVCVCMHVCRMQRLVFSPGARKQEERLKAAIVASSLCGCKQVWWIAAWMHRVTECWHTHLTDMYSLQCVLCACVLS